MFILYDPCLFVMVATHFIKWFLLIGFRVLLWWEYIFTDQLMLVYWTIQLVVFKEKKIISSRVYSWETTIAHTLVSGVHAD